jgi:putative tricarboxylic transport membrane protein
MSSMAGAASERAQAEAQPPRPTSPPWPTQAQWQMTAPLLAQTTWPVQTQSTIQAQLPTKAQAPLPLPLPPQPPSRCVVPAKPGGGFDLTCLLARRALGLTPPLPLAYQPGGIGALVFNEVVRGSHPADELVAFSSGTLLNLAEGRFGLQHSEADVRWLAALALDHGVVAVRRDAPWQRLTDLLRELKARPNEIAFAMGGSIGSQDWMKTVLLARAAGISHKAVRVVAFEGGGDAVQALLGGHVQVLAGDAAEITAQLKQGVPLKVLAVLAPARVPGRLHDVPTAREQGHDLAWPILRGVYVSRRMPEAQAAALARQLEAGRLQPGYREELQRLGLQPAELDTPALQRAVQEQVRQYAAEAQALGVSLRR